MRGHVLVLNQDYRALSLCSVERAIVLLHLHKVDLVEAAPDRFVRSPSTQMPWPSIIRLKGYIRLPYKKVMLTRKNVFRRDAHRCQYCDSTDRLTIDHVIPRSRGGRDTWENLVAACTPCNSKKGSMTLDEAMMPLRRKPFRPSHVMFIRDYVGSLDEAWKPYLFLA